MSTSDEIVATISAPLLAAGFVVEQVSVVPAGKRRVVRIAVDRDLATLGVTADDPTTPVPALSLDDVSEATRVVDTALESSDVFGDSPYTLEVSSPGLGRPLEEWRHYRRNVGRLVTITTRTVGDGQAATLAGRLTSAGPDDVIVEIPAAGKTAARTLTLAYGQIARAVVTVEFTRAEEDPDEGSDARTEEVD